jgi:hypothetical protein
VVVELSLVGFWFMLQDQEHGKTPDRMEWRRAVYEESHPCADYCIVLVIVPRSKGTLVW